MGRRRNSESNIIYKKKEKDSNEVENEDNRRRKTILTSGSSGINKKFISLFIFGNIFSPFQIDDDYYRQKDRRPSSNKKVILRHLLKFCYSYTYTTSLSYFSTYQV